MSRNTSKLIDGVPASPTGYIIQKILLYTNTPENAPIDIKGMVTKISITESLYTGSIQTELTILDAVNLIEEIKLNGQELIHIKLSRDNPDLTKEDLSIIKGDMEFDTYIADVVNYSRNKPGSATYQFKCLSKHMFINNTKTIGRAFENTTGNLIKKICSSDLKIKETKGINESSNNIKGIYPKLRPYAAIQWLVKNSFDGSSSPYYFYETVSNGVQFKSYSDMIKADPYNEGLKPYIHAPFYANNIGDDDYYVEAAKRIRKLSSDLNLSKYISTGEGAFASQTHQLDIYNKTYEPNKWTYKSLDKLNKNKPFIEEEFDQFGGRKLNQCTDGKNYFISLNSGNKDNYSNTLKDNLNKSQGYLANESIISHDIELAGDFDMEPGMVLNVKFLKTNLENLEQDESTKDVMLTGKYLVTSIVHNFGDEYIMDVRIKTDSFNADLNDIITIKKEVSIA